MFQFHAGIGGGETPVYSDDFLVPLLHPCLDLPMQGGLVWNPAIQAASHQGTQFNLGHIQPTAVLGRVVEREACSEPLRLGGLECLGEGSRAVRVRRAPVHEMATDVNTARDAPERSEDQPEGTGAEIVASPHLEGAI